ncbi:MAG: hypothetical protein NVSMB68_07860 [Thermoanaerobaculia bacterium]
MPLLAGTVVGRYVIAEHIGSGGMGEVYRARDPRLERDVALKVLAASLSSDTQAVMRFEREARAVSALHHPGIVHVYDVGSERIGSSDVMFIAVELVDGVTLRAQITQRTPVERLLKPLIDVAAAIAKAHSAGIVHRDLKPENIMITVDGFGTVLDFGLAKLVAQKGEDVTLVRSAHSSAGLILGTAGYMAPEQTQGLEVDERADIFAFGCVLFEAATGTPAFRGNSTIDTMHQVLHARPSMDQVPRRLHAVIQRCLAKSAADRFQQMEEVAEELRGVAPTIGSSSGAKRGGAVSKRSGKQIASIAVLPFANESGDPDAEYLSDGITETLINSLLQIPKLRVASRNSVFRYKGRADVSAVAADLDVDATLTGRVSHRGQRMVVAAELTDTRNDAQLWGDHYSRPLADLLEVQKTIAGDIAAQLRPRLSGQTRKRVVRVHTEDPEAYQMYLKGRYYLNKRSADALRRAITFFQDAIDRDPAYARGYAGLADAWTLLGWYALERPQVAFPRALAAARQAVVIDSSFSEAHTSAAYATFLAEWNVAAAEKEFQSAIAINPSYAFAHHWYADLLQATGRAEQAIAEAGRACAIDPLALILNAELGRALYYHGEFDRAIAQQRKTLELEPDFVPSLLFMGQALDQRGHLDEAVAAFEACVAQSAGNAIYRGYLGYAQARRGDVTAARRIEAELNEEAKGKWIAAFAFTLIAIGAGDHAAARQHLGAALEERSHWILYATADPAFQGLWRMDDFREIKRRIDEQIYGLHATPSA